MVSNMPVKQRAYLVMIAGLTLAVIAAASMWPPIPQSQSYHNFVDQRNLLGIPNFLDVVSNAVFVLVGLLGLRFLYRQCASGDDSFSDKSERLPYAILFLGLALTGIGSAYYHLAPDNARLTWDRLPLTLVIMPFLAATIAERIGVKAGLRLLIPLTAVGLGSVVYWHWSEVQGAGDLRPYILVQYYPMLAIPLMVFLFPSRYTRSSDLLGVVGFYAVAKAFEVLDAPIFALGGVVSGHTLKHLVAGVAVYWILRMLRNRHRMEREVRDERG